MENKKALPKVTINNNLKKREKETTYLFVVT